MQVYGFRVGCVCGYLIVQAPGRGFGEEHPLLVRLGEVPTITSLDADFRFHPDNPSGVPLFKSLPESRLESSHQRMMLSPVRKLSWKPPDRWQLKTIAGFTLLNQEI